MPEPEQPLIVVRTGRLLGAALLSSTVLGSAAGLIWLVVSTTALEYHLGLFAAFPLLLGVVQPIWKQVVGNHGFTLNESPDGLRTKRGLFDLQRQTVPPGRVQGLAISEPLLWRRSAGRKVDLDIAGVAGSSDLDELANGSQLLPVGDRGRGRPRSRRVLPGLDLAAIEMRPAPRNGPSWLRPIGWRYLAYGRDDQVLVTVKGWVNRQTSWCCTTRPSRYGSAQGPLQRRLRLATVHVDTPYRTDRRGRAAPRSRGRSRPARGPGRPSPAGAAYPGAGRDDGG